MDLYKIVVIGDKDAGKSTLIGKIAILTKAVSYERVKEAKNESEKLGKKFEPAFILDAFKEEREKGLTIDTTTIEVPYKDIAFQFIDVPGHEYLIKNMLTGASDAKVGLVVISVTEGLTRETKLHIKLANMLGINKFIFFINKMDIYYYSKDASIEIFRDVDMFLTPLFNGIKYIEFNYGSALKGENIMKPSKKIWWYKGNSLMEDLYAFVKDDEKRNDNMPSIIGLQGTFEDKTFGKIISGDINQNKDYYLMPDDKKVSIDEYNKNGSSVSLKFSQSDKADISGKVLVENKNDIIVSDEINAKMFFIKNPENYFYISFLGKTYKATLKINENEKNFIFIDSMIKIDKKIAYQKFVKIKDIGRFVIYDKNLKFNGFGIIK